MIEYAYTEVANEGAASLLPVVWGDGWFYTRATRGPYTTGGPVRAAGVVVGVASGARGVMGEAENVYPGRRPLPLR